MNDMKRIVTCHCGKKEYLGMMHWRNGQLHCRRCIADIWKKEDNFMGIAFSNGYFPFYEDGKVYTAKEEKEERK